MKRADQVNILQLYETELHKTFPMAPAGNQGQLSRGDTKSLSCLVIAASPTVKDFSGFLKNGPFPECNFVVNEYLGLLQEPPYLNEQ